MEKSMLHVMQSEFGNFCGFFSKIKIKIVVGKIFIYLVL